MTLLFDSTNPADVAPETPRAHVPLVVRIPIDVDDVLNDLEGPPSTKRRWPNERQRQA